MAGQAATLALALSLHHLAVLSTLSYSPAEKWQISSFIQVVFIHMLSS